MLGCRSRLTAFAGVVVCSCVWWCVSYSQKRTHIVKHIFKAGVWRVCSGYLDTLRTAPACVCVWRVSVDCADGSQDLPRLHACPGRSEHRQLSVCVRACVCVRVRVHTYLPRHILAYLPRHKKGPNYSARVPWRMISTYLIMLQKYAVTSIQRKEVPVFLILGRDLF